MVRCSAIIFLHLLSIITNISGQPPEQSADKTGELFLRIKSISFVKNNEYFNPIVEGYTLLGSFLQPSLVYTPSEKVTLRAGAHLLYYSGEEKYSQVKPVFSATLNISEKTSLTFGALAGNNHHKLFDPNFNLERLYTNNIEDGIQLISVNKYFITDTWVNWENFISKGDTVREVFTAGESFNYKSDIFEDLLQIEIPFQLQLKHYGGQISNYKKPVEFYLNIATGLRINLNLAGKRYGVAGIEYLQFINNEYFRGAQPSMPNGNGSWFRLHYNYKALYVGAAFWNAHNHFAPDGNQIYSSISDYDADAIIPDRRIISNSFSFTILPESYLELYIGLETYYDIDLKHLDNSVALHLNFDKLIKLAPFKH